MRQLGKGTVIDYLASILAELSQSTWPDAVIADEADDPRILSPSTTFPGILATAFDQLRQFSIGSIAVQCRLLEGLRVIARSAIHPEDQAAIAQQAAMILRQAERNIDEPSDLQAIRYRYDQVSLG